jgi:hypothetical protein
VSEVWSEHGSAFAAYWREELHEQPDVRAAMFLAALQDLLSLEDDKDDTDHDDDDGERPEGCQQQLQLGPLVGVACPELQDIPHLLASPDLLLALLTEPYLHHQRQHLGPPPPQQQQHEEGEEAVGREALHAVRRCCLLQLGCNLLLLSLAAPEGEEESP